MGTHPIFESDFDCLTDLTMRKIVKEVEDLRRFLYRTEYFIRNDSENIHPDTLKYYLKSLTERLNFIRSEKLAGNEEVVAFQTRISSCQQCLDMKVEKRLSACPSKISRTADLESRQLLLRGSAQRETEQRAQLLDSSKISKIPKNQEKHLTLRQRRLLLLENDDASSGAKMVADPDKQAEDMAKQTLELTKTLRDLAMNTKAVVKEDNKLLEDMDGKMEKNLGNLKQATESVEEILNSSGSAQYFILMTVFIIWIFMIVIITTVPKLN